MNFSINFFLQLSYEIIVYKQNVAFKLKQYFNVKFWKMHKWKFKCHEAYKIDDNFSKKNKKNSYKPKSLCRARAVLGAPAARVQLEPPPRSRGIQQYSNPIPSLYPSSSSRKPDSPNGPGSPPPPGLALFASKNPRLGDGSEVPRTATWTPSGSSSTSSWAPTATATCGRSAASTTIATSAASTSPASAPTTSSSLPYVSYCPCSPHSITSLIWNVRVDLGWVVARFLGFGGDF